MAGPIPFSRDVATWEEDTPRKDLPCTVTSVKPELGFDFRFQAGYDVTVPLKELSGEEGRLTMIFRVTPTDHPGQPVYLVQHVSVPEIEHSARGDVELSGIFSVGEGKYHINWMMRDRSERVCSSSWDIEASLAPRDKLLPMDIAPDEVLAAESPPFREEPPSADAHPAEGFNLHVIVNFAPQDSSAAVLGPNDANALISILRTMSRDPRAGQFSLVVFNSQEQRVIYRQEDASQIDFPALGRAVRTLTLGRVDARQLAEKHGEAEFLGDLLTKEIAGNQDSPDAVIIAGPKAGVDDALPPDALKQLGDVKSPIFYMDFDLAPVVIPGRDADGPVATGWHDAIGSAVRFVKGAEYTIAKPRDVYFAWSDIAGRIVKSKVGRNAPAANGQKP